ncbi:Short-chain dehydrogenase/reductase family protein [Mycena sanguinolenta]|uniref:Short-chain dehydrogenase/reductase family protein n=1 Tax=Mycena sanguinolenta TaxID=230812 RepID=A0A8H6YBV6_9AGAR|nr:Short-chain dehydrogenase/reductase family protein [Mycena sanguinolenta]
MAILSQPAVPPLPDSLSFAGKTAIVTGASGGLGLAAALHLVQRNISTLVIAVRTKKTGEAARDALLADPIVQKRATKPTILVYELDLARPSSVASFASKVLAEIPTLNIVILNAGIGSMEWKVTPETETEHHFQVNFLSNAVLSVRLLPLLRSSAQRSGETSHLSTVGSRAITMHSFTKYPVPDTTSLFAFLNDRAHYRSLQRYSDSKVLVSMWVHELAKHVNASQVIVNNVCPGMVRTNLEAKQPWWVRGFVGVMKGIRGRSTEVGARTMINAVVAGRETHGELLGDYTVWQNTFLETAQGKKMEENLWKESLAAVESSMPGSVQEAMLKN